MSKKIVFETELKEMPTQMRNCDFNGICHLSDRCYELSQWVGIRDSAKPKRHEKCPLKEINTKE